ncbi:uncharacterized protein RAG0_10610 [Rhynchosporium agropyri]|uniref:Uncharacterized protein n=1 Tax=Rhynchosporium agropyri TaxID=914238 RepID=A0A1E1L362_9HELO|nr:uncharacterized protein RAG0_10610 [Rhynchosporium agropyri]
MAWTSQEVDSRFRKVEFNRRTKKAIAFIFACVCAAQLTQRHSGEPETETIPIEKLRGNSPAHIGVSSRWPVIIQEKQPLDYGGQTTLLNVLAASSSAPTREPGIHISNHIPTTHKQGGQMSGRDHSRMHTSASNGGFDDWRRHLGDSNTAVAMVYHSRADLELVDTSGFWAPGQEDKR